MSAVIFDMSTYRMETKTKEQRAIERIEKELSGKVDNYTLSIAKARVTRLVNQHIAIESAVSRIKAWAFSSVANDNPKGAA